jgi:hypothetical protein
LQTIRYTGKTSTTFTGCGGGSGTMNFGAAVIYVSSQDGINHTTQASPRNHGTMIRGCTDVTISKCIYTQTYGDCIWNGHSASEGNLGSSDIRILNVEANISARQESRWAANAATWLFAAATFKTSSAQRFTPRYVMISRVPRALLLRGIFYPIGLTPHGQ